MNQVRNTIQKACILLLLLLNTSLLQYCSEEYDYALNSVEQEILDQINVYRYSKSLLPLELNETLQIEAEKHSANMAQDKVAFGHDGFSERTQRIHDALGGTSIAENVAQGYQTATEVVNAWRKSEGHNENLLGDYNLTGISCEKSSKGIYFYTMLYLKK